MKNSLPSFLPPGLMCCALALAPSAFAQSPAAPIAVSDTTNVAVAGSTKVLTPFVLLKGQQTVSSQLQTLAAEAGWKLIWEASDFMIEQDIFVSSDFFKAVTTVVEAVTASGSAIKATFYQGNYILRITGE